MSHAACDTTDLVVPTRPGNWVKMEQVIMRSACFLLLGRTMYGAVELKVQDILQSVCVQAT